jgi:hypothetical protein
VIYQIITSVSETARHEQPDGILRRRTDDGLTAFAFRPGGKRG